MSQERPPVVVNGTRYRWPDRPVAVVIIDGGDPAYLQQFLAEGALPHIARFMQEGFAVVAEGTVPSFTCPNNMSIVTGTPASRHGISGNFYLDTATGEAVVMTGPELLRGDTVLKGFADAGAKVVAITAKDKLRKQLGKGLDVSRGNVCFSSEKAGETTLAEHGIDNALAFVGQPQPGMYSMELSLFVLDAGIRLLEAGHRDLLFLSLTDYVQHKYAPHEAEARRFYQELDRRFGRLAELGATVVLTADHGMNDKSNEAGEPNVIWLQDILDARFGKGDTRVICPITDAFVAHHGALGGFVRVWCRGKATPAQVIEAIRGLPGLESVLDKEAACRLFDLPADREGDVVVISTSNVCVGASEKDHDLSGLKGHRLRTHGGTTEAKVPLIISRPLNGDYKVRGGAGVLKSWQLFDFALNGVAR
ncbi:MAG: phosphonoacetate hydrolase [Betaproteobacteria bacterium]|nr:phosphonoacetate hydrolase [Betaproteobacteria bacterium]PWB67150.1 MAG: phosphonoacetate hydrolase [Betaproteobacteria bacterium]